MVEGKADVVTKSFQQGTSSRLDHSFKGVSPIKKASKKDEMSLQFGPTVETKVQLDGEDLLASNQKPMNSPATDLPVTTDQLYTQDPDDAHPQYQ